MVVVSRSVFRRRVGWLGCSVSSLALFLLGGGAACAQDAGQQGSATADTGGVQEIVVTAERRANTAQRTALAITALAGDQLQKQSITAVNDALRSTMGTVVQSTANGGGVYIRGIGSAQDPNIGGPSVNLNVDGIYQQQPDAPLGAIYDVQRIEVLRGPQGTLYGRNANAGSVNIISNDPNFDGPSGRVRLSYGNYDAVQAEAAVNVPLGEALAVRVSAYSNLRDGYLHPSGYNDANEKAIRGKLLFSPNDDVRILMGLEYVDIDRNGDSAVQPSEALARNDDYYAAQATGMFRVKQKRAYLQGDFTVGPGVLTVIPAVQRYTKYDDRIVIAANPVASVNLVNETQISLETRYASLPSAPVKWVVGAFYLNADTDNPLVLTSFTGRPVAFGSVAGSGVETLAGFGQVTIPLFDRFRVTLGGRYTHDRKSLTSRPAPYGIGIEDKASFDSFTYKAGFEYDVTPRSLFYGNVTTGFKAGGLDERFDAYKPEKIRSLALGLKNRFFNNRLQVNIEGFDYHYTDYQATYSARCQNAAACSPILSFANAISNAGRANVYGFEGEVVTRPWYGATLSAGVGYTHSKLSALTVNEGTAQDLTGTATQGCSITLTCPVLGITTLTDRSLANAPKWTVQLAAEQSVEIGSLGTLTLAADTKYSSSYITSYSYPLISAQSAFWRSNARIDFSPAGSDITISGFIKNIENNAILTGVVSRAGARMLMPPRTYGVQVSASF
ncbi:MAG: TonB-dependent receptor [Sphingobium sp.]